MLMKSIVISTAAALLGPTIGVAVFFVANSDRGGQSISATATREGSETELDGAGVIRNFAPEGVHLGSTSILAPKPKPQVSAPATAESAAWRTVIICAEGQTDKDDRCPMPKIAPGLTSKGAIADLAPPTGAPTSPLPGRMSVSAH
jgi:hypothetical protein